MKSIKAIVIIALLGLSLTGCRKAPQQYVDNTPVTLTYYKLNEPQENLNHSFVNFQKKFPNVTIQYKTFNDYDTYIQTILNEMSEGAGPDLFSVPNTWVSANHKKLKPAPIENFRSADLEQLLVGVAFENSILKDNQDNEYIYTLPLGLDMLGMIYNKEHYEISIPERGKPASNWQQIQTDNRILTAKEQNKISRAGIQLGNPDFTSFNADLFYLKLLQNNINFYKDNFSTAFGGSNLSSDIVSFITSFADSESINYTTPIREEQTLKELKEIESFLRGETSMLIGYNYTYQNLFKQIEVLKRNGVETISPYNIRIQSIPQETITETPIAYANYFTEVVNHNSKHTKYAWQLLAEMISKPNLEEYYENSFKPSSRRDILSSQLQNRIFGDYVSQIGYAKTIPFNNKRKSDEIINEMMFDSISISNNRPLIRTASQKINQLIPREGVIPKVPNIMPKN